MLGYSGAIELTVEDENKLCKRLLFTDESGSSARAYTSIPRSIIQFWDQNKIPDDVAACMSSWKKMEDMGYQYTIFNNATAQEFISKNFSDLYLQAYKYCHHPAMKCDYFRMLYLLSKGGIYSDADNILLKPQELNEALQSNLCLYLNPLFQDKSSGRPVMIDRRVALSQLEDENICVYFANDPLICERGDPVIRLALDRATRLIISNGRVGQKSDIHDVTGPSNITKAVCAYFNYWQNISFSPLSSWHEIVLSENNLRYKDSDRNWRNEAEVLSDT